MNILQLKNLKWIVSSLIFLFLSMNANAESNKSHLSPTNKNNITYDKHFRFSELDELMKNEKKSYLTDKNATFNPNTSRNYTKYLGDSIEFEVYQTSEDKISRTVFKSNAGVCKGLNSKYGVKVMDSRIYYVDKPKDEYYASVVGATAYSHTNIDNVRYTPILNMQDLEHTENVQAKEYRANKELAEKNIKKSIQMLENVICR